MGGREKEGKERGRKKGKGKRIKKRELMQVAGRYNQNAKSC